MKFITKIGVTCTTIAMMASTLSYAGSVPTETLTSMLTDHYIGADGNSTSTDDYISNNNNTNTHYDTTWMQVEKTINGSQGSLSINVKSNFIGYDSKFKLGDLFLMDGADYQTASSCLGNTARGCDENSYSLGTNKWEYAFDLGLDLGDTGIRNSETDYSGSGMLRDIDTNGNVTKYSSDYHQSVNTSSQLSKHVRSWQIVDVKGTNSGVGVGGNWNTDVASQLLTMSFDISGTTLMDADQIALRWAMSCANDIIEVVTNFKTPTSVPEPSTLFLMILAGFGLFVFRQKKGIRFKA